MPTGPPLNIGGLGQDAEGASELAADVQQRKRQRRPHLGAGDIAAGDRVGHHDDALAQCIGVAVQIFGHKPANERNAGLAVVHSVDRGDRLCRDSAVDV
jgi:hypothetical protein